jgi:hypothetical protein
MPPTWTSRSSPPPGLWWPGRRPSLRWPRAKGWPTEDVPTPHPGCPGGCWTSAVLPLWTRGVGRGRTGVSPGAAPPPASGRGSCCLGSDVPPRNLSHRLVVGRSPKPPGRAAWWIFGRWGTCGSEPYGTRWRPEAWEPVQRVRHLCAHLQVNEASCMSGPLDRDLWSPGRWGPMATHVSQRFI